MIGQLLLIENLTDGPNWLVGQVITKLGQANYNFEVQGQVWKRHADQLMAYKGEQLSGPKTSLTSLSKGSLTPSFPLPVMSDIPNHAGAEPLVKSPSALPVSS